MLFKKQLHDYHNPAYDSVVSEAHDFVSNELGLVPTGINQISVIDEKQYLKKAEGKGLNPHGYAYFLPDTGDVVAVAKNNFQDPDWKKSQLGKAIVHELTHSATVMPDKHFFYKEALAGMGEQRYLERQRDQFRLPRLPGTTLDYDGFVIQLPGDYRNSDVPSAGVGTSTGLVAAYGMEQAARASGISSANMLAASQIDGMYPYEMMRLSLDTVQPGLSRQIEQTTEESYGLVEAVSRINAAVRQHR